MPVLENYYEHLYHNPVVSLRGYCAHHRLQGSILAYLDFGGATGSARTRQPLASSPVGAGAPGGGGSLPAFQKGDTVRHKAFGQGMVLSVQKMGGDALLEIAFDNVGTKRLMLKSAAAHMQKV